MCYIQSSFDVTMKGWCGGGTDNLRLALFSDADFAGCVKTARSSSGVILALVEPISFLPLTAITKRQAAKSHSTPESELVAADLAVHTGWPGLTLWEALFSEALTWPCAKTTKIAHGSS